MSAPPIPNRCSGPKTKTWAAWQFLWDELGDGEWHRSRDIAHAASAAGVADVDPSVPSSLLRSAFDAGLIEREERPNDVRGLPGMRVQYRRTQSWYRRKAHDATDSLRCPRCDSRSPNLHPAAGDGGEVTGLCPDPFHGRQP